MMLTIEELNEIRTRYTGGGDYDYLQARLDVLALLDEIDNVRSEYESAIDKLTTLLSVLTGDI